MMLTNKRSQKQLIKNLVLILLLAVLAACSPSTIDVGDEESTHESEHEEDARDESGHEEDEHEKDEHEHEDDRIPNDGASIRFLSPTEGTAYAEGDEVAVDVEVSGFALGEDDNHWHIYVDGVSWGMVVGGRTSEAIRGLEPGERKIEVYLNTGEHVELQDGDSVAIRIE